jgi:hypothetical protein
MDFSKIESLKSLDVLFAKIADILGVGVDAVAENGMEYVMMYGRYHFLYRLPLTVLVAIMLTFLAFIPFLMIWVDYIPEQLSKSQCLIIFTVLGVVFIASILISSLTYIFSPEMYSIKAVIDLLGNM